MPSCGCLDDRASATGITGTMVLSTRARRFAAVACTAGSLAVCATAEASPSPRMARLQAPLERPTQTPARPDDKEPPRSLGMLVAGSVIGGLGLTATLTGGITMLSVLPIEGDGGALAFGFGLYVLIPGQVLMAIGVPLTVVGGRRYHRWRTWRQEHAISPVTVRGTDGTPGFGLRFAF